MSELEQLLKKSRTIVRRNGRGRRLRRSPNNPSPSQENAKKPESSDAAPPTPIHEEGGFVFHNVAKRSTTIAVIGYNQKAKELAVAFKKNQAFYVYPDITARTYKRLLKAKSIGGALKKLNLTKYERLQ